MGGTTRLRTDLQLALRSLTVAGAARVSSSGRTALPASRLTAHAGRHARAPRCPEFKSGTKARQESGTMRLCGPFAHSIERSIHRRFIASRAGFQHVSRGTPKKVYRRSRAAENSFLNCFPLQIKGRAHALKTDCCYVWKRTKFLKRRRSALKCEVLRGRSTCSTNSNHCHRISAG
jgi:hypothetical protein